MAKSYSENKEVRRPCITLIYFIYILFISPLPPSGTVIVQAIPKGAMKDIVPVGTPI